MLMHGCKEGQCAACKSFVLDGEDIELDKYSTFALPDFEKEEGYTLLCRAHVYEDVTIELLNYDEDMIRSGLPIQDPGGRGGRHRAGDPRHAAPGAQASGRAPTRVLRPGSTSTSPCPGTEETRSFSMANTPSRATASSSSSSRSTRTVCSRRTSTAGSPSGTSSSRRPVRDRSPCATAATPTSCSSAAGPAWRRSCPCCGPSPSADSTRKATVLLRRPARQDLCFENELRRARAGPAGLPLRPGPVRARRRHPWDGEVGMITDVVETHETRPRRRRLLRLRAAADGRGGHARARGASGRTTKHIYYDKFTTTEPPLDRITERERGGPDMTDHPGTRACPKPEFTDAEAGASESSPTPPRAYNYFTPKKRKQTHYEDVTVEVQPDPGTTSPRAGCTASPTASAATRLTGPRSRPGASHRPEPERFPGSGGKGYDWPAHGWHEFRDPNEEWELTLYRYNANVVRQINANIETARETKAFEQWNSNWVQFVERNVGAWMHVEHGLGLYLFANAQPPRTDQHAQQRDRREHHAPDPVRPGPRALQPHAQRGGRGLRRHGAPG